MSSAPNRKFLLLAGFATLALCFLVGFFHRFAPATFADAISHSLGASEASLGAVFAWHFWVYTVAQIPAGMLVDRFGVRRCVFVGTLVTAAGSFVLAGAESLVSASLGPALTGAGLSVVFVGIIKFNATWFRPENYGLITGFTMLLATSGAVLAGSPMAHLLEHYSWRLLFALAAGIGVLLSLAVALIVRDRTPINRTDGAEKRLSIWQGLITALRCREIWPLLLATVGTNGTFYAFAGLWGVPVLTETRNLPNTTAVLYTTTALIVYSLGCLGIGILSDRVGLRKPFLIATSAMALLGWSVLAMFPWQAGWQAFALYALVGAAAAQVTVSFAALKESVPAAVAATSLAILNAGVFAASAVLQPLFGLVVETSLAWNWAIALMTATSLVGLVAAFTAKETRCRPLPDQAVRTKLATSSMSTG